MVRLDLLTHDGGVSRIPKEDMMERTLTTPVEYEAPNLHPVGDTPQGAPVRQPDEARGDPAPGPGSERPSRRSRFVGYGVVVLVLVVLGAMLYTTRSGLSDARDEITSLESDIAATEAAAADAARSAADDAAALQDRIADLVGTLDTTEDELATTRTSLADAFDDTARLEQDVADLEVQIADAGAAAASTRDDVAKLDALTAFELAWWTWGTSPDDFEWFEAQGIDIDQMDEAIRSLGLAANWETWAGTNFFVAVRVMGNYVDAIDDPAVTAAWDAWLDCNTMDGCGKAVVELEGALASATASTMTSLRAVAGASRAEM